MNKMDDLKDLVNISKLNELLNKKEAEEGEDEPVRAVVFRMLSRLLFMLES